MSTDPSLIQLTPEQKQLLAQVSEQSGKPWPELLDSALRHYVLPAESTQGFQTLYDAFVETNALGSFDGPHDLSTNPKHLEGFGQSDD